MVIYLFIYYRQNRDTQSLIIINSFIIVYSKTNFKQAAVIAILALSNFNNGHMCKI